MTKYVTYLAISIAASFASGAAKRPGIATLFAAVAVGFLVAGLVAGWRRIRS